MKAHVPLKEFIANGGKLEFGRALFERNGKNMYSQIGVFKKFHSVHPEKKIIVNGLESFEENIADVHIQIDCTPIYV